MIIDKVSHILSLTFEGILMLFIGFTKPGGGEESTEDLHCVFVIVDLGTVFDHFAGGSLEYYVVLQGDEKLGLRFGNYRHLQHRNEG